MVARRMVGAGLGRREARYMRGGGILAPIPLPHDASIFGTLGADAGDYLSRVDWLTLTGDSVTAWDSADGIGPTLDAITGTPQWLPTGGVDGLGCVRFTTAEYAGYIGTSWAMGSRPSTFVVFENFVDSTWIGSAVHNAALTSRVVAGHDNAVAIVNDVILTDGTVATVAVNPIDGDPHVCGSTTESAGAKSWADGVDSAHGALTGGVALACDRHHTGGHNYDISEWLTVDNPTSAQVDAYHLLRLAEEYPSLPL